ncbi:MAG: signal peptidase I, partial [Bacillota bacterium]
RDPAPGEIVVFREPGNDGRNLVKRVVAVHGQEVEVRNGDVFLDGMLVRESFVISPSSDTIPSYEVPEGTIFVMGDNRVNSLDSRYFGPVPVECIRGRAFIVFWPLSRFNILSAFGTS